MMLQAGLQEGALFAPTSVELACMSAALQHHWQLLVTIVNE